MVFAMFGRKSKAKALRDGRVERRRCPLCGATTDFRECKVEKTYTAYVVVKLWNSESTAFMCTECDEVMDLDDTEPRERAQLEAKEAKEEKIRQKKALLAAKEAERKAEAQEAALDDELAAMKSRLGID